MSTTIFIYSKYSNGCKNFLETMQRSKMDLASACNLKLLCIDNEKVRPLVLNNKKIQLGVVPTVLVIFANGVVEKYEGHTAFSWLESVTARLSPSPAPAQERSIIRLEKETENIVREKRGAERPKKQKKSVKFREEEEDEEVTGIEDLPEEEEYETESEPEEDDPPASKHERKYQRMRTGAGSEEYNEKLFKDPKPSSGQIPTGSIRGDRSGAKVSNVMAQAQAMQRQRDKIEEKPPSGKQPPRTGQRF